MPCRAPSSLSSKNEVDISQALLGLSESSGSEDAPKQHPHRKAPVQSADTIFNIEVSDDSDDATFIADSQSASNRKASNLKGRSVKKGGGFQAMGLNSNLLKAITRKGFSVPTPIQRKTIPMVLDGQDVVGMARTGSGKTAAFVVPMIDKLKGHSAKFGARALVLSPSRELALQTFKVVKEFGRGTDLTCVLLVGGDSLEEQFGFMSANPDILIATPGRFLHLKVEMGLDLASIHYVVFDEADRLFEMGFAAQLTEILHALPQSRQTLLFSATLPKSLVEFARAGLQEPKLVRLDTESKISPDLESAFFTIKSGEKEGALLHILNDIIKIPLGENEAAQQVKNNAADISKKRKRGEANFVAPLDSPTAHSTIIFAATKHHVEYLALLLRKSGFAVSHVYGSLDQIARKIQVQDFRTGISNVLVVTDVAARGIDIPILANVINYDFPPQPKIFVHRVGRTARAGQKGWSYSLIREPDAPYLFDLQLFLGKRLVLGREVDEGVNYAEDIAVGSLVREPLERNCEWAGKLLDEDPDLIALRSVAAKGEKLYLKTRNAASCESARRSKDIVRSKPWTGLHPLFKDNNNTMEFEREEMLARVSGFRPRETVFEIGKRGSGTETTEVVKKRRAAVEAKRRKVEEAAKPEIEEGYKGTDPDGKPLIAIDPKERQINNVKPQYAPEDGLEITFSQQVTEQGSPHENWKDPEFFMPYTSSTMNVVEERGYGVHSGSYNTTSQVSSFVEAARGATMDLTNDDGAKAFAEPSRLSGMRWDKKNKKYVARANDEDGSKVKRLIRGESGQKIAASFRSGRFDTWRRTNKIDRLPRAGESEKIADAVNRGARGKRFRHHDQKAPKEADKYRDDYWKKKKLVEAAKEKRVGRFKDGKGQKEIKGVEDVRRARGVKESRKKKTARPGRKQSD